MAASIPIIAIGASAGGVEAISQLVRGLPEDFPGAVFIALHFPMNSTSYLPRILTRAGKLPASHAEDGAPIEAGHIYVAPPDRHLIVLRRSVHLVRGGRENGNRPAVDPMFRSAAVSHGRRVVGVVLTGNLDDGTAGLLAIKRRGGTSVVQDPGDALFPSMPVSAIKIVPVDFVLPLAQMPDQLRALAAKLAAAKYHVPWTDEMDDVRETLYAELDLHTVEDHEAHPATPLEKNAETG